MLLQQQMITLFHLLTLSTSGTQVGNETRFFVVEQWIASFRRHVVQGLIMLGMLVTL